MWLYLYVIIVNKFGYLNPVIKVVYKSTAMYFSISATFKNCDNLSHAMAPKLYEC